MTETRTVLFTDLTDFTAKVSGTDREGLHRILREHEDMVRPIVEGRSGRVVKNMGDSFLCMFPAATDALRAALEIQEKARTSKAPTVRVAITTGDVEEIDGDTFGEPVNIAARILGITPGDEIWFGMGTRVCMNDAEIPWESVGFYRFKGVPTDHECFRVVPKYKAWLPHGLAVAARSRKLVRLRKGDPEPTLPPDPIILFEAFEPGSSELEDAVGALPVLDPASFYLAAYNISGLHRQAWTEAGYGLVIGTPESIDVSIKETKKASARLKSGQFVDDASTMFFDGSAGSADLELVIFGLALPSVPFSDVVASYSYELLPDERWVPRSDQSVLRVDVRPDRVILHALAQGLSVGGSLLAAGESMALQDNVVISTPSGELRFVPNNGDYKGFLLAETAMRLGVMNGQTAEIGRKPNAPGLAFPNRAGQENIRWCSGARAARARREEFSLDRMLTGRRQAAVKLVDGSLELVPLHEECPTYLMRGNQDIKPVKQAVEAQFGDFVIAGVNVVQLCGDE